MTALAPQLETKSRETEELMQTLTADQQKASKVKTVIVQEEAIANKKAAETKVIADDAQKDLDQALPALNAANKVCIPNNIDFSLNYGPMSWNQSLGTLIEGFACLTHLSY